MKIRDFMEQLYRETDPVQEHYAKSCDTLKLGDPEQGISRVGITMFPTRDVLQQAADWGANLLIVHEPTFYNGTDDPEKRRRATGLRRTLIDTKEKFIREHGITIYRFHDHPHLCEKDMISLGVVKYGKLEGTWKKGELFGINELDSEKPVTALELAKMLEKNLRISHIRICGSPRALGRRIGLCFGATGNLDLALERYDVVLSGEFCEWADGEFARDYADFIAPDKALLVLGHCPSERDGMRFLADRLAAQYRDIPVRYFETQEVYTYTD